jgi:hypothetical protein
MLLLSNASNDESFDSSKPVKQEVNLTGILPPFSIPWTKTLRHMKHLIEGASKMLNEMPFKMPT